MAWTARRPQKLRSGSDSGSILKGDPVTFADVLNAVCGQSGAGVAPGVWREEPEEPSLRLLHVD